MEPSALFFEIFSFILIFLNIHFYITNKYYNFLKIEYLNC
ncbi:hypothetical protein LEP1GSC044_1360 [Leptospira kirschneri serovar Grippotyphosa str. RM52]|nr:hypothetical protein LEP1GSC044_1360 [Leptospira kirschneri serovar Grippotyphosa str. RM52]